MQYYRMYYSIERKVVGCSPQISKLIVPGTINDPKYLGMLSYTKSDSDTKVPFGILDKKAKLTDCMSVNGLSHQYFVSDKLKSILSLGNSKGVEFLPTKIYVKEDEYDQFWIMNPYRSDYSFLDVNLSTIGYTEIGQDKIIKEIKFNTLADFLNTWEQNIKDAISVGWPNHKPLIIEKIAIKPDCGIDFLSLKPIRPGALGYFVSEDKKNEIDSQGCIGVDFIKINESRWE